MRLYNVCLHVCIALCAHNTHTNHRHIYNLQTRRGDLQAGGQIPDTNWEMVCLYNGWWIQPTVTHWVDTGVDCARMAGVWTGQLPLPWI